MPARFDEIARRHPKRSALERRLAAIWAEVLGLDEMGVEDDFFDLGGHSLLAARLGNRVRAGLGVDLPLAALLSTPTVAAMAALIAEWQVAALPADDRRRLFDPPGDGGPPR
jgi:acyl carrier protein